MMMKHHHHNIVGEILSSEIKNSLEEEKHQQKTKKANDFHWWNNENLDVVSQAKRRAESRCRMTKTKSFNEPPKEASCPGNITIPGRCLNASCPMYRAPIVAEGRPKTMRMPARPMCMLQNPEYKPPLDDANELSRFLRLSTLPGYSRSDTVSEYNGNYNHEVWDSPLKSKNVTQYNIKRDWLNTWGEFNVIEQRWRKAWTEKYGAK